jgi:hypothetical protein
MTQSQQYQYTYYRCDNCGNDSDHQQSCQCGSDYYVQATGFDSVEAQSDGNLVSSVQDGRGTLHTLSDGSTYYQSNSGW